MIMIGTTPSQYSRLSDNLIQSVDVTRYYDGYEFYDRNLTEGKFYFSNGYVSFHTGNSVDYSAIITDYRGSTRVVMTMDSTLSTSNIVQANSYYPSGALVTDVQTSIQLGSTSGDVQTHKFLGKELDRMYGLDWYDLGARRYDAAAVTFWAVDPLAEQYYHISPYAYCAGDPVNYTDPTGMEIEEGSLNEWRKLKLQIEKQKNKLKSNIFRLNAKAENRSWSSVKLASKIGNKKERLASLNSSVETMETLESSTQVYSLSRTEYSNNGGVTLNTNTNVIDIKYGSTANFVHEMTHAGQFEKGDIAFSSTGMVLLQDVFDEIAAYKAQFGYNPFSVNRLTSISMTSSFGAITPAWVQGLRDATGSMPYAVGGQANTGLISVNMNSSRDDLIQAYPWIAAKLRGLPINFDIRTLQGIYFKR